MLKGITEVQRAVIECQTMGLKEAQALEYIAKAGLRCKRATYYTTKNKIRQLTRDRLALIAAETFEQQHLDRIDELLLIKKEMWINYENEEGPYKRVMILKEIKDVQRYISAYYEATQDFIKDRNPRIEKRLNEFDNKNRE